MRENLQALKQGNEQTRNLLNDLITTVKDASLQTRISQLKTSTKRKQIRCMSLWFIMKLVEEALAQISRSEFREDITDAKTSIDK